MVYTPNDYAVTEPVVLQKFKVVAPNDPDRVVTIVTANPDDKSSRFGQQRISWLK